MNKKTYKYFKDRERKHQEEKIKDDEKFSKVLEKEYQRTLREIENRINWWIGKYADDNVISVEQAKQIVTEADINELKEKAKEYVKNKDLSPKANKEMKIYNLKMKIARDELLQKYIDLELAKLGTKEEKLLEDRIFNETEEELKRQAGILGDSLISKNKVKGVFEQIVNDSHVSAHFSYYIWTNIKELRNDLQNGLNRSILRGQNPNVWKSDLYKHFNGNIKKAEFYARRLAVTETAIAQTKAGLLSAKQNGYDGVIVITEPGACETCKPHDGVVVSLKDARMGDNVPIWHPFCRCTIAAYLLSYEEITEMFKEGNDIGFIKESNSITIDGKEYKVDGRHVKIKISEHEREVSLYLHDKYGGDLYLLPQINEPSDIKSPDILWDKETWDIKGVKGTSKNTIYNNLRTAKKQADNVILDFVNEDFTEDIFYRELENIFSGDRFGNIDKILVRFKKDNIRVFKRK